MLESLNGINLGKDTENDFKESKSVTIIREQMEKNNKIKVRTNEADKIPNLDGKIMILDDNSMERITVEVQIKTLPSDYYQNNPYKYLCDTKAFNVVKYNVTFNPVIILLVDENSEKIYWKYLSKEYVNSLNIENQKSKTIYFSEKDIFIEEEFLEFIIGEFRRIGLIIENGSNPYILSYKENNYTNDIQNEVDRINLLFDGDLNFVKKYLFPNVWKFGIAYDEYENGSKAMGIYSILKGKNDILIRNFDIYEKYMQVSITSSIGSKTITQMGNEWIEYILNMYFNLYGINPRFLPEEALNEIVYEFLDRLAFDVKEIQKENEDNYINDEENIETVMNYYNGLKNFYYQLVNRFPNSQFTQALMNIYKLYGNKFLIFNPLLQPNKEEYNLLLNSLFNHNKQYSNVSFVSSDIDINLLEATLVEIKNRNIKKVSRVFKTKKWSLYKEEHKDGKLKTCAHGYILSDLYSNLNYLFNNITKFYDETYKKMFGDNESKKLKGKFVITYSAEEPYKYCLFYHKSEKFMIKVENINEEKASNKYESFDNYNSVTYGLIDSTFGIKLPLYNYIRLLINLGISLSYGVKFKYDNNINRTYQINQLPIISNYIQMTNDK